MRVHDLVPHEVWQRRFDHIRHFEQMLVDEGTVIRKFFLHISKDDPARTTAGAARQPGQALEVRARRPRGAQVLGRLHRGLRRRPEPRRRPTDAPWYVIPSDRKWYRNLLISTILVETLEALDLSYPEPAAGLDQIKIDD